MKEQKSIYKELYEYYKNQDTKISQKVFDVLDREGIPDIILYGDTFWFELYSYGNDCPQIVYDHIKKTLNKHGYTYLHDVIPKGVSEH